MTEKTAAFYDAGFSRPGNLARLPLEESPWLPLYQATAKLVPTDASVVDLGCGTGRFARLLADDHRRTGKYLGIDFSPVAVAEARRYVPTAEFMVGDLRTCPIPRADTYVCLEVLEHIDDDLGLLQRLPTGAQVILTVPSFRSKAHVRTFPSAASALERYDELIGTSLWRRIPPPDHFHHLVMGGRR